jgi:hypothetical protein
MGLANGPAASRGPGSGASRPAGPHGNRHHSPGPGGARAPSTQYPRRTRLEAERLDAVAGGRGGGGARPRTGRSGRFAIK